MRLDRNEGKGGKYAVLNMRKLRQARRDDFDAGLTSDQIGLALSILENRGLINYGQMKTEDEFFVLMLKDAYSYSALNAYAQAVSHDDWEYSVDVKELAQRSGLGSPFCKVPD